MRPVCGIQGTWPRASTAPPSPPPPILPLPGSGYPPAPPPPHASFPWVAAGSVFCSRHRCLWMLKSARLYVCTLPRQVFVTLFGLGSWAPVTVPLSAALANVTGLAEARRRLSFNHWSLRTTHLIRLDLRFTAAGVTQPNPGVNQLITDPCVLRLCHHRGDGEGGVIEGRKSENIDLDIKRSTVSITRLYTLFPFSFLERGRVWGSGFRASLSHPSQPSGRDRSLDPWDQSCYSVCGFMYQLATNFTHTGCASACLLSCLCLRDLPWQEKPNIHMRPTSLSREAKCCVMISFDLYFACDHWLNWGLRGNSMLQVH